MLILRSTHLLTSGKICLPIFGLPTWRFSRLSRLLSLLKCFVNGSADAAQEPRRDSIYSKPSPLYPWADESTYVRLPSFFEGIEPNPTNPTDQGAHVLLKLGDSVTTDHIGRAMLFLILAPQVSTCIQRCQTP